MPLRARSARRSCGVDVAQPLGDDLGRPALPCPRQRALSRASSPHSARSLAASAATSPGGYAPPRDGLDQPAGRGGDGGQPGGHRLQRGEREDLGVARGHDRDGGAPARSRAAARELRAACRRDVAARRRAPRARPPRARLERAPRSRAVAGDHERQARAARTPRSRPRSPSPARAGPPRARTRPPPRATPARTRAAPSRAPARRRPARRARAGASARTPTARRSRPRHEPLLPQRQPGGVGGRLSARAAAVQAHARERVAAVAAGAVLAVREARADRADEPVVVQVQDDPRARRARGVQRAPAERRLQVVGVDDAGAGARARRRPPRPGAGRRRRRPSAASRADDVAASRARAPRRPRRGAPGSATRGRRPPAPLRPRSGSGGGAGGSRAARLALSPPMALPASICFPTRRRRDYLEVALASVAPQAAEHGAEIVVVEDEAEDPLTKRLVERPRRPLRRARRPEGHQRRPQRVRRALDGRPDLPARRRRARLAGLAGGAAERRRRRQRRPDRPGLRGRALPLVRARTAADHRARPRPVRPATPSSCGARTSRFTRSAFAKRRPVRRPARGLGRREGVGDAAARRGRQHPLRRRRRRRPPPRRRDARLSNLCRGAYHRGREARKHDTYEGKQPVARRRAPRRSPAASGTARDARCMSGIVLTALSAGRVAETFDPTPLPPDATQPDFLSGRSGTLGRRTALAGAVKDALARTPRQSTPSTRRKRSVQVRRHRPARRTCAPSPGCGASCSAPSTPSTLHLVKGEPGAGKWAEPQRRARSTSRPRDWLLLVDDDVILPRGFLDRFVLVAERFGFELAQPAHAFASHAAWEITRRRPGRARPPHALRRDRPDRRAQRATPRRSCCRSRTCAWAGAWTPAGARSPPSTAGRSASIDATPDPPPQAGRRRLPARRRDRRGRGVPGRPRVRHARPGRPRSWPNIDEAGPVRHQPRARVPDRRVPGAERARSTSSSP